MQDSPNKSIPSQRSNLLGWSISDGKYSDFLDKAENIFNCLPYCPKSAIAGVCMQSLSRSVEQVLGCREGARTHFNTYLCNFWRSDWLDRLPPTVNCSSRGSALRGVVLHLLFVLFFSPAGLGEGACSLAFLTMLRNPSFCIPSMVTHFWRLLQSNKGISHQLEAQQLYPSMSTSHLLNPRGKMWDYCSIAHVYFVFLSLCSSGFLPSHWSG